MGQVKRNRPGGFAAILLFAGVAAVVGGIAADKGGGLVAVGIVLVFVALLVEEVS